MATSKVTPDADAIVSEIHIAAPPERVFEGLVDLRQVVQWWGEIGVYRCTEFQWRALTAGRGEAFAQWLYATLVLGLAFIGGQLLAWRELVARGVYLSTNPSSSFFYLLTSAHGIHLLGGIGGLIYLVLRARRIVSAAKQRTIVEIAALYWHFMDGLWIYLLLLLTVRS